MNNNVITLQKIDGTYDIQAIITPASSVFEIATLAILFFIFFASTFYFTWFYLYSKKAISKRKIKALQTQYTSKEINSHDTIYNLCNILRRGLQLKNLNNETPLPKIINADKKRWACFMSDLSDIRYKNDTNPSKNIPLLFEESLFWLKAWS